MTINFSEKVEILAQFYADVCENEEIQSAQFMQDYSGEYLLCLQASVGYILLLPKSEPNIEYAWQEYCKYMLIDEKGDYAALKAQIEILRL